MRYYAKHYKVEYSNKGDEDVQLNAFVEMDEDSTVEDVKKIFEKRGCIVRICKPAEDLAAKIWNGETSIEEEGLFYIEPFTDEGKSLRRMTPERVCAKVQDDAAECYDFGDQHGFSYCIRFGDDEYTEDVSDEDVADAIGYELDEDGYFEEGLGAGDIASKFEDLEHPRFYELCLHIATDACIGQSEHLFGWPAKISIDGGKTYCTISQALAAYSLDQLKKSMVWNLRKDLRKYVQEELPDGCTDAQFLMRYLELAPVDLIIE